MVRRRLRKLSAFVAVTSGSLHSCGLREDGSVNCWGTENLAEAYPKHGRFTSIDIGLLASCAIRGEGSTVCWGDIYGSPETLEIQYSTVSIGFLFTCGLLEDGAPVCRGSLGPLFDEDPVISRVPEDERLASISSGMRHVCALRSDGTAVCWGSDENGEASPPRAKSFTAISSGGEHTCALDNDGIPVCWGRDDFGQASPPQAKCSLPSAAGDTTHAPFALTIRPSAGERTTMASHRPLQRPTLHLNQRTLWESYSGDFDFQRMRIWPASPTVADDAVFLTLYDNTLYALDASTGNMVWRYRAGGWITASPVVEDGVVYAGSWDHYV